MAMKNVSQTGQREVKPKSAKAERIAVGWASPTKFAVPIPKNEVGRIAALRQYKILDTPPEVMFDDVVALAAYICGTPIALVSLVDSDRQWFKARVGMEATQTSRDVAFCAHAIMGEGLFIVPDALADPRFAHNPLVISEPKIRFYAGAPLVTSDHHALGTLCVMDRVPRVLTPAQKSALQALARQVMTMLELRRELASLKQRELTSRCRL